jgi:pseudaminic acid cytidylyltransferase
MRLCVIPARGGSKRIPRKNIKYFCGQPMISRSIQAAKQSNCFDKIIVSTDDVEISKVALEYGAEVPFTRPHELSCDFTETVPVIKHAIQQLGKQGFDAKEVCCLYATSPFVRVADITKGLKKLIDLNTDYIFSATTFPYPIQRALRLSQGKGVSMLFPDYKNTRSQDLDEVYHDAGQFYWGTSSAWLNNKPIFGENSAVIELPRTMVQDIDTHADWEQAELKFRLLENSLLTRNK